MTDNQKPLAEWSTSWLKVEVASLLRTPSYLIMTRDEKLDRDLPSTDEEMREFIRQEWGKRDEKPITDPEDDNTSYTRG